MADKNLRKKGSADMKEIKFYSMRDAQMQRGQLNLAFKNLDDVRQWFVDIQEDIKAYYTDRFGWNDKIFNTKVFKDVIESCGFIEIDFQTRSNESGKLKIFEKNLKIEDIDENEDKPILKLKNKVGDIEYYNAYSFENKWEFKSLENLCERICLDAKDSPYIEFIAKGDALENGEYENIPIHQFRGRLPIYKVIERDIKHLDMFAVKYFSDGYEKTVKIAKRIYMCENF